MSIWDWGVDLWESDPWMGLGTMPRWMEGLWRSEGWRPRTEAFPAVNIWASDKKAMLTAEIPGVAGADIEASVEDHTLTIRGERKLEDLGKGARYHRQERGNGSFIRQIRLPFAVEKDKVDATCRDGILRVALERTEQSKPRRVEIKG